MSVATKEFDLELDLMYRGSLSVESDLFNLGPHESNPIMAR